MSHSITELPHNLRPPLSPPSPQHPHLPPGSLVTQLRLYERIGILGVVKRQKHSRGQDPPNPRDTRRILPAVHKEEGGEEEEDRRRRNALIIHNDNVTSVKPQRDEDGVAELQVCSAGLQLVCNLIKGSSETCQLQQRWRRQWSDDTPPLGVIAASKHPKRLFTLLSSDWSHSCSRWNAPRWSCRSASRRSFAHWRDSAFQSSPDKSCDS